jgi:hypothetical protein
MLLRRALTTLAATLVVGAFAAAPANATIVTINGPGITEACWIFGGDGIADAGGCGQALLGYTRLYDQEFRGLLWFDVANNVPPGSTINSATMRLPKNGYATVCGLSVYGFEQGADWRSGTPTWSSPDGGTTSWDGGSLTWMNHPGISSNACNSGWAEYNITDQVTDWHNGVRDNNGIELLQDNLNVFGVGPTYTDSPELVIDFT